MDDDRRKVGVDLFANEDFVDLSLENFITFLRGKAQSLGGEVFFEYYFEGGWGYDSDRTTIRLWRYETDEEVAARQAASERVVKEFEDRERAEFERLKRKYGADRP